MASGRLFISVSSRRRSWASASSATLRSVRSVSTPSSRRRAAVRPRRRRDAVAHPAEQAVGQDDAVLFLAGLPGPQPGQALASQRGWSSGWTTARQAAAPAAEEGLRRPARDAGDDRRHELVDPAARRRRSPRSTGNRTPRPARGAAPPPWPCSWASASRCSRTSRAVIRASVFGSTCSRAMVMLTGTQTSSVRVRSRKPSWEWKMSLWLPAWRRRWPPLPAKRNQ